VAQRQTREQTPELGHGEILRSLGAACDREELDVAAILENQGGYRVAGVRKGVTTVWSYQASEVTRLVEEQRARRGRPNPPP